MKTFLFFLLAISAYGQQIDPRTQINWPRVSGTGSPVSAGFACGTNYGQPYTDTAGPHYWVCTPTGWFQVDGAGGNFTDFKQNGVALTGQFATNPQTFDMDDTTPAAEAGYLNGKFLTDSATGKVSIEFPATTQQFQMYPLGVDSGHVFIPFGSCTTTQTGVVGFVGCDSKSGQAWTWRGGIFGYAATATMNWTGATLPSWLPAGNVTSIQLIAYSEGGGPSNAHDSFCSGGGTCSDFLYPPNNGQVTASTTTFTGSTIGNIIATARLQNGPYCGGCPSAFTMTGFLQVTQIGLLVGFTGVTKPVDNALNIAWPLTYQSDGNVLGVSNFYPYIIAPVLVNDLPGPQQFIPDGSLYWVTDNTQTTIGGACTGSGTAGTGYAICRSVSGTYKLVQPFGAGYGVASVTAADSTLTITPTSGNVTARVNLGNANTWTANQNFNGSAHILGNLDLGASTTLQFNNNPGTTGQCPISQGAGATPIWGPCGGGGSIPNTTYMLAGNGSGGAVATAMDDGHTTAGTITSTEPIAISDGSGISSINMVEGSADTAAAGHDILYADSTNHCIQYSANGGAFSCLGAGTGTVTGSGTTGFIPIWTGSTALGPSVLDYGITTASTFTFAAPVVVNSTTLPTQNTLTYSVGHAPTGLAGSAVIAPETSGNLDVNENNTGFSRVCTAANGVCSTSTGLSGMTAGQVPIAATATTVTSSKAIQGTDTSLLSSGTISGTGSQLCTDANGGATTTCTRQWSCQPGLGDGLNAISAGTYLQSTCYNTTGSTVTLTGLSCFTDNSGSSTINAAGNTLGALLTGAVTCTSSFAAGTQSANVALTSGDYIKFTFVADGTSKQTTWIVKGTY